MKANGRSTKEVMTADEAHFFCRQVLRLQLLADELKIKAVQKYIRFAGERYAAEQYEDKIAGILGDALKSIAEVSGPNGKPDPCKPGFHLEGDACVSDRDRGLSSKPASRIQARDVRQAPRNTRNRGRTAQRERT